MDKYVFLIMSKPHSIYFEFSLLFYSCSHVKTLDFKIRINSLIVI